MKWNHPSKSKIYEALSVIADDRIELSDDGISAKSFSSSRNKFYEISYDASQNAIMSNDNSSYWKGDLGYPAIAFLMKMGILPYDLVLGNMMKGIAWKDINQRFKNDFDAALEYVLSLKTAEERKSLATFIDKIDVEIARLNLNMLGEKTLPPAGY